MEENEIIRQLSYAVSHDVGATLRGIRGFAGFLLEDYGDKLDNEGREYLNTIKRLGDKQASQLKALLFYLQIGMGETVHKDVDIWKIIEAIKDEQYTSIKGKKVAIEYPQEEHRIVCDKEKVILIFRNLIENAVSYNDNENIYVEISHKKISDGRDMYCVSDNGIGMDQDNWEDVFKIFKKLHTEGKYGHGIGAGLAFVRRAVLSHGGSVGVKESGLGKGSVFEFTIKTQYPTIT